jgi:hypothetical protein
VPTPQSIIPNGASSNPVAVGDARGDQSFAGQLTIGTDLVLTTLLAAPIQTPYGLTLYSPDGRSLQAVGADGSSAPVGFNTGPFAAVTTQAPATVTGTTSETVLAAGITVPAGALAARQIYDFDAWGTITTTADIQTVTLNIRFGGVAGTVVMTWGSQNPDSSATLTNAAWSLHVRLLVQPGLKITGWGLDGLNFFPSAQNEQAPTSVTNTGAQQFVLTVIPSATAVSMTVNGSACVRVA